MSGDPYIYYIQSRGSSAGRELTIFFETVEDNTIYRGAWEDMDGNGKVSDGDRFMYAPLLEGEPEWEKMSRNDKNKFGKFLVRAVKDWDKLLKMWKDNAIHSDCGPTDTGEEYLAQPDNLNYWIRSGEDFLLFRPIPPPIGHRELARIDVDSPDYLIMQSAYQQCVDANAP